MRTYLDAKIMARTLRSALGKLNIDISVAQSLEMAAAQFGCDDWNVLAAKIEEGGGKIRLGQPAPIFRIFDEAKAREFYVEFLGFEVDWEHRFGENFPLYMQVSRSGLIIHLTGHHGDASPGAAAFVRMSGIVEYRNELIRKNYTNMKPGIEDVPWGREMTVIDPFGNKIRFCESPE